MEEHRRDRTRINYSANVLVKSAKRGAIKGKLRDISVNSLHLYINPIFEIDEHVKVIITLLGTGSQLAMNVPAVVVRKDPHGIAMRFLNPLEWWPIFTFFPLQSLDSGNIHTHHDLKQNKERHLSVEQHRRNRTRTDYSADVFVKSAKRGAIKGRLRDISILRDISLNSLYLYINPIFEIDEQVKVEIILFGTDSQLIINVPAVVVRKDLHGIAMDFLNPLEWWPVFSLFPLQSLDSGNIPHRKKNHLHNSCQILS